MAKSGLLGQRGEVGVGRSVLLGQRGEVGVARSVLLGPREIGVDRSGLLGPRGESKIFSTILSISQHAQSDVALMLTGKYPQRTLHKYLAGILHSRLRSRRENRENMVQAHKTDYTIPNA